MATDKPDDSHLSVNKEGLVTAYVGKDAVSLFRARVIASALRLYAKTKIKANRAYTPKNMLAAATDITGKSYKRGQFEQAAADIDKWAAEMKAALPIEEQK